MERAAGPRPHEVGERIRALRKARGLTLVQLGEAAALSNSFLSQVERGHAVTSMTSLERIGRALGVGIVELLAQADGQRPVDRSGDPRGLSSRMLLNAHDAPFHVMEFSARDLHAPESFSHVEAEAIYVVSGRIRVELADRPARDLGPGDFLMCPGGVAHRWTTLAPDESFTILLVKQPTPGA